METELREEDGEIESRGRGVTAKKKVAMTYKVTQV
jgi:hypothetical protein